MKRNARHFEVKFREKYKRRGNGETRETNRKTQWLLPWKKKRRKKITDEKIQQWTREETVACAINQIASLWPRLTRSGGLLCDTFSSFYTGTPVRFGSVRFFKRAPGSGIPQGSRSGRRLRDSLAGLDERAPERKKERRGVLSSRRRVALPWPRKIII